jgi:hypothetical protein
MFLQNMIRRFSAIGFRVILKYFTCFIYQLYRDHCFLNILDFFMRFMYSFEIENNQDIQKVK